MFQQKTNQRIFQIVEGTLSNALSSFFIDRKSRGLSKRTIDYYEEKLFRFQKYTNNQGIQYLHEITPDYLRLYMLQLSQTCNNGGVHAHYRALRSFFNWFENENDNFKNPITKVSPPKVNHQVKEGISIQNVMKMVKACVTKNAARDKAILLTLVDTGCRASEVLWVTNDECRLTYSGLREIIRRRAGDAKIKVPGIHDFRRCFAIEFLRNDGDIFTLQRILGHSSLEMVKRYLAIAKTDCETAHRKASPVDNWKL